VPLLLHLDQTESHVAARVVTIAHQLFMLVHPQSHPVTQMDRVTWLVGLHIEINVQPMGRPVP
jgi:hypothetical protein